MIRKFCTNECQKWNGTWDSEINRCFMNIFLNRISLRVRYVNSTGVWEVDDPPYEFIEIPYL